ncbi:MAG: diguanylate cyclase [Spirochaetota bacterium]|nr:diguanylate cyclase [Spirochaetota bacterium]
MTFSCGIASFSECETPSELNDAADKAMYEAKTSGRNRTVVHKKKL